MRTATISRGGQIQVPAEIRHRWGVSRVVLEDEGDAILIRPLPDDPIAAAQGSLSFAGLTTTRAREALRQEELEAESRRRQR